MTREERAKQVREQYSGSIHGFDEQAQIAAMLAFADAEAAAMRERAAKCVEGIGEAYGEDETGWLDCSETAAAAIRALPATGEVGRG